MTYCVGLLLNDGMVLLSDTRTNAGLDNIATYRKMFHFEVPGDRVISITTAGSLSVTQTTIARLREAADDPDATPGTLTSRAEIGGGVTRTMDSGSASVGVLDEEGAGVSSFSETVVKVK